ncbi:probable protein phosphatase 2C 45 [Henckelia pumila]|uniref:probable protein phosphatase 2C 45 n=1 Tax=Henckelia pumila TaxID=405737 RepID=UPI003C6DDE13
MARANDNWERLVGAVIRRNRDWEMCHAHSRTPSMSSAASSRDDPFLDKFESIRSRYINVEDQYLEAFTRDDIKTSAQGIGKTMMGKKVGEVVKQGRSYFDVDMLMSHDYVRPVSGGGLSSIGKFSYGYASFAGKRSSMEDFYETRIDVVDGEEVGFFGVFDGHGRKRAAEYVQRNLFRNLISHPKFISDTKSAIADSHSHTDAELLRNQSILDGSSSTACTAILVADRLLVANVGDSRAVICRAGQAIAVSRDHKPDQEDERRRIEDVGGFVAWEGVWRVGGVLPVSRAFGNRLLKPYVVADPEIHEEKVDETLEFLILASHGLWDVFTNVEAVQMTEFIQDPEEAAKRLMQEALRRGSADNITAVVVRFPGH